MAIGYLDSQKLTNIANAIRSASGSETTYTVDQMPGAIRDIAPEAPRVFKDVNFFDYDGTILYQYDLAEAKALTELPPLPSSPRSGYTADSWTETLSFIQNLTGPCDVGVNYTTTNEETQIVISIPENNFQVCVMGMGGTNTGIDWGDGTARNSIEYNACTYHTYAQKGEYTIIVDRYRNTFGNQYYLPCNMFRSSNCAMIMPYPSFDLDDNYIIKEVWLGGYNNYWSNADANLYLSKCKALEKVMIPSNASAVTSSSNSRYYCFLNTSLKHITIPSTCPDIYSFQCGTESIVLPSSTAITRNYSYFSRTHLRRFISYNYSASQFVFSSQPNDYSDEKPSIETIVLRPRAISIGSGTQSFERLPLKVLDINVDNPTNGNLGYTKIESFSLASTSYNQLGSSFFYGTKSLRNVTFQSNLSKLPDYCFYGSGIRQLTIPNTVTTLGSSCFAYSDIESLTIPNGITAIPMSCFDHSRLQSITIPDSVTSLGDNCFRSTNLTTVELPVSITTIPSGCFQYSPCLETVYIKGERDAIGGGPSFSSGSTFAKCYKLTGIYIYAIHTHSNPSLTLDNPNTVIYVPRDALEDWKMSWASMASKMQPWDPPTN